MKNPNIELKKWFVSQVATLTGLSAYDGIAPSNAANDYVVITGRTSSQQEGKTGYINECSIICDIVTKSSNFGFKSSEAISELILAGINSDTVISLPTGWSAKSLSVESISNLDGLNPEDNIFRTLINYSIIITQTA